MSDDAQRLVAERVEELLASHPPAATPPTTFWRAQFDHGLAWVWFPRGHGGLDIAPRLQRHVDARLDEAGAPTQNRAANVVGLSMAAPTLLAHGSNELRSSRLRPLFSAEEIWCQLFSEPGAGSDLAGLATSAVLEGDQWRVRGQKVWTTLAHRARWALLLARTDPDVPKHKGLTYFVLDMTAPGVEVRPLYEITGEAEFNEVYLEDVRVPDSMRLGDVGRGWHTAMTTLMNERASAGRQVESRGEGVIADALRVWGERAGSGTAVDAVRRDQLARLWVDAEILRLTEIRAARAAGRGQPGPEGSVTKLRWAEINQAVTDFTVELLGADGTLFLDGYHFERPEVSQVAAGSPHKRYLRSRANSIEGGTSQVMRNILAERVLGMPAEPRDDRDRPWREVPRG
jgi:alkylation response protein AidB-like acyl-CoA dehydrogenase